MPTKGWMANDGGEIPGEFQYHEERRVYWFPWTILTRVSVELDLYNMSYLSFLFFYHLFVFLIFERRWWWLHSNKYELVAGVLDLSRCWFTLAWSPIAIANEQPPCHNECWGFGVVLVTITPCIVFWKALTEQDDPLDHLDIWPAIWGKKKTTVLDFCHKTRHEQQIMALIHIRFTISHSYLSPLITVYVGVKSPATNLLHYQSEVSIRVYQHMSTSVLRMLWNQALRLDK